jgi:phosphoglycerate transport regulatory protein PgtC
MRRCLAILLAALALAGAAPGAVDPAAAPTPAAPTKEVVVLTSFPKELFEGYRQAFEGEHPGVRVVVKQQQTNQGVTYLRETRARPDVDIFWVSAVDAFQTLKADGLLDKLVLPKETLARMPAKVGGFPLHDPDGQYWGFAVSGYGLMWNTRYLALHKLPAPKEWTDLADPRYYGHLSISAPSRSGTTHLTVEVILQAYGWEKGWALLMQMGGNMGAIAERSFGVPEAVISGQLGIGVVIDFFGLSAIASGQPIDFAYPSLTAVVPASVAVVKSGPNPFNARAFVQYLLSDAGQLRLFSPEIGRLPVVPALYSRAPRGYPNPFTMKLGGIEFDDKLSSSRRNIVNALFDQIITYRHTELKAAWRAIYAAEAITPKARPRAEGHSLDLGAAELVEARRLASTVPLDAKQAADKAFNQAFKEKPDVKSRLETEWDSAAKSNYGKAIDRADQAARMR